MMCEAGDFFQNNPHTLPLMVEHVVDAARGGGNSEGNGVRHLVDAYCGAGLFALAAARRFEAVAGIEISASSVAFARENALANGVPSIA